LEKKYIGSLQVVRKGILDSELKEFLPNLDVKDSVHRYISFGDVDFNKYKGSWYILGKIRTTVNELRMMAKDKGLYFMDNKGNKSFTAN
jgi:hypothetical protein